MREGILFFLGLVAVCFSAPQSGSLDSLISQVLGDSTTALPTPKGPAGGNLDGLISSVFNNTVNGNTGNTNNQGNAGNLDGLIADVFNTDKKLGTDGTTSPSTILGTENQNQKKPDDCECVPYYQCQNGTILDNGIGIIDIRLREVCENYLDVCCKPPDLAETPRTPPPTVRKGCGQRHPGGVGFRITGDEDNESQFGEFPWVVALLQEEMIDNQKLNVYQCGGALIHRSVVLTAAHCVNGKRPEQLKVRAGEWDTQTNNEIYPHQDRDVKTVIVHEKFHSGALYNDIALLILKTPVDYAENVDIVCLPEANAVFDGSRCFASGWGKNFFGKEGTYQVILKRVELPIIPSNTCQNSLRQTRLGKYYTLDQSFICAGGELGKDTCKGDGGSALVCPLKNDPTRYVQAGIVSWGIGCGDEVPGVYANVARARYWIDEQMAFNTLDSTVYQYNP